MSEKKLGVFDFVNSISYNKIEFTEEEIKKTYDPYITVMAFTNYPDTVHLANAINCFKSPVNKIAHYKFLFHLVRKKKRYSDFYKKDAEKLKTAKIISSYFGYSISKSEDLVKMFSDEDIAYMVEYMNDFGGIQK